MWISLKLILFIGISLFRTNAQKYTLCTLPTYHNACDQLNRSEDIACVLRKNAANCLLLVEAGNANFTVASAEDAALASTLTENIVVIGDFRNPIDKDNAEYATAVIVKSSIRDFQSLKGARFCHPGIDNDEIPPAILKELEVKLLKEHNVDVCTDRNTSANENYIGTLQSFLGSSCRPGKWTIYNQTLDLQLKAKYSGLMKLCVETAYSENLNDPFLQSLNCVLSGDGDFGLTTIRAIKSDETKYSYALNKFMLLCKNGTVVNITEECTWTKQPLDLLVGNAQGIGDLPNLLTTWFGDSIYDNSLQFARQEEVDSRALPDKLIAPLREIVFPKSRSLIKILQPAPTLREYFKDFRSIPSLTNLPFCNRSITWCTSENEMTKCKWLQQAALNYGIQPVIHCKSNEDKALCINELLKETVDVAVISDNMLYYANRKNVSIIGFGEQELKHMKRSVLVVNTTLIKNLDDIKGKRGCFAEYGDRAFTSFILLMKNKIWPDSSFLGKKFNEFLNQSCMPGIEDEQGHEPQPIGLNFTWLCALCEGSYDSDIEFSCKPDYSNRYYGNQGALNCLGHKGDFAVLTLDENLILPNNKTTKVMCKNGTLANTNTLAVDDDCVLSITIDDIIIGRKNDSAILDIILMLTEMEKRFALQSHTAFKIFDTFGDTKDLIFKDVTVGLEMTAATTNKYMKMQLDAFANIPDLKFNATEERNSAKPINLVIPLLILVLLIQIII